jgi:O-antigen ligase
MHNYLSSLSSKKDILLLSLVAYLPISRAVFFVRNQTNRPVNEYSTVDLQNSLNIAATALMVAFLLRPRARPSIQRVLRGPTQCLVLFYAFCLTSCLWASNSLFVAYRAAELLVTLFFMAYLLDRIGDPYEALLYLCRFCAVTALLPYLSGVLRDGNLFQHTNAYSTCGAFGAALALASIRRGVLRFAEVKYSLLACLAAVIFGTSSASNVALLVGVLLIAATPRQRMVSIGRLLVLSAVMFVVLTRGFEVIRPYVFPGKTTDSIRNLRGRTSIYQEFWGAFQEHPVVGYGFASGERSIEVLGSIAVNSAHNSVLSVAVNTGIVGLLFFCVGFYRVLATLYRAEWAGDRVAYPVLLALIVGLINSMSYPLVGSDWKYVTTAFFGIVAYASVFLSPVFDSVQEEYVPAYYGNLSE